MADSTVTIDNLQKELKKAKDTIESSDSNSNGKIYIYFFKVKSLFEVIIHATEHLRDGANKNFIISWNSSTANN